MIVALLLVAAVGALLLVGPGRVEAPPPCEPVERAGASIPESNLTGMIVPVFNHNFFSFFFAPGVVSGRNT